jgi:hypothetical protein
MKSLLSSVIFLAWLTFGIALARGEKPDEKARQSKNASPPEVPVPPRFGFTVKTSPGNVPLVAWIIPEIVPDSDAATSTPASSPMPKSHVVYRVFADALRDADVVKKASGALVDPKTFLASASKTSLCIIVSPLGRNVPDVWRRLLRPDTYIVILDREKFPLPTGSTYDKGSVPDFGFTRMWGTNAAVEAVYQGESLQREQAAGQAGAAKRGVERLVPYAGRAGMLFLRESPVKTVGGKAISLDRLVANWVDDAPVIIAPAESRWLNLFDPETRVVTPWTPNTTDK